MEYNPLMLSAAKHVLEGETVRLFEFPNRPIDIDSVAFGWELKAPTPVNDNFHFLLADFREDTLKDESFDLIVTDWFIDIVLLPMEDILRKINRLLKPGGTWINHGPLLFKIEDLLNNLSREEVLALVERCGFKVEERAFRETPYHRSPYESQQRTDTLVVFRATKAETVAAPARRPEERGTPELPAMDTGAPIARTPSLEGLSRTFKLRSLILDLVDGQASVDTITDEILSKSPRASREDVFQLVQDTICLATEEA